MGYCRVLQYQLLYQFLLFYCRRNSLTSTSKAAVILTVVVDNLQALCARWKKINETRQGGRTLALDHRNKWPLPYLLQFIPSSLMATYLPTRLPTHPILYLLEAIFTPPPSPLSSHIFYIIYRIFTNLIVIILKFNFTKANRKIFLFSLSISLFYSFSSFIFMAKDS